MSGNKDKFVIRHMQYGKSINQAILLFKEYVEKHLGKDIKIEIVDFEKIKELEDENAKLRHLLIESLQWVEHEDDLESPLPDTGYLFCMNRHNNCLKCRINKKLTW